MRYSDLIFKVSEVLGVSKSQGRRVVDTVFTEITKGLIEDGEVSISGIGHFKVKKVKEREYRNPATGGKVTVPEHNVVKFRASKKLKDYVNKSQE